MFTCVLNTTNTNIRYNDLYWYRFIKGTSTIEMLDPYEDSINLLIYTTGTIINS